MKLDASTIGLHVLENYAPKLVTQLIDLAVLVGLGWTLHTIYKLMRLLKEILFEALT